MNKQKEHSTNKSIKSKEKNNSEKNNSKKGTTDFKWFVTIFIVTFILSIVFSFISTTAISGLNLFPAIIILVLVIFVGIIFDIIGVAVTVANEHEFHAKASKKIPGAKSSIVLIRNSAKVANICADVIGDICGVLSGSISAIISFKITSYYALPFDIQFIISAIVASLTVGGKAIGKVIAQNNSTAIVHMVGKIFNISKSK